MLPDLYLWTDDSIGLGHKMRMFAIGEEWVMRGGNIYTGGMPSVPSIIIFDGYAWEDRAYQLWHDAGHIVVVMEDRIRNPNIAAHVFVDENHRAWARGHTYPRVRQLCFGVGYVPIRKDYKLVAVSESEDVFDADAVRRGVEPDEFVARMAKAKVVVCSAGVTAYEALFLRKPVLLRLAADNQKWTYQHLIADGYAFPEDPSILSKLLAFPENRQRQAMRIGELVDGGGARRICDVALREWHAAGRK